MNFLQLYDKTLFCLTVVAIASMFVSYFQVSFWLMPAERQTFKIRKNLFKSILAQNIGWFDVYKSGELTNRLTEYAFRITHFFNFCYCNIHSNFSDVNKIRDGLGDKFGSFVQFISTFIASIIIGFVRGWKLTLVILSLSPLMFISAVIFTKVRKLVIKIR